MRLAPQQTRTYHVTAASSQRRRIFQVTATAELMQQTLFDYRNQGKYSVYAYVVMPDHIHVLLTPSLDVSLEKAVQFIKGGFSFRLKSKLKVWTRGFNQSQVLTPPDYQACCRYIEDNPVRKRLAIDPEEFAFSSASHRALMDAPPLTSGAEALEFRHLFSWA